MNVQNLYDILGALIELGKGDNGVYFDVDDGETYDVGSVTLHRDIVDLTGTRLQDWEGEEPDDN